MKQKKLMVLGSSGTVGTAIETTCPDSYNCIALKHEDIDILETAKLSAMIQEYRPSAIINCVAMASIDPCEKDPEMALNIHCRAVAGLAQACRNFNICLIQPSSHAIFDGMKNEPYTEDDLPKATGVYAATKLISERLVSAICTKYYIARFPTLFGPRRNQGSGFVDKVIDWLKKGHQLKIADDKMDSPTYSIDAARCIFSLIEKQVPYGIYHISNQGWVSYYDLVVKIRNILKAENTVIRAKDQDFPSAGFKPLKTGLSSIKIKALRPYEDALKEFIENYVI